MSKPRQPTKKRQATKPKKPTRVAPKRAAEEKQAEDAEQAAAALAEAIHHETALIGADIDLRAAQRASAADKKTRAWSAARNRAADQKRDAETAAHKAHAKADRFRGRPLDPEEKAEHEQDVTRRVRDTIQQQLEVWEEARERFAKETARLDNTMAEADLILGELRAKLKDSA